MVLFQSALKEAKSNEIRKDSIDRMISQMKKRMEENGKMEKEIQERKKDCFRKKYPRFNSVFH